MRVSDIITSKLQEYPLTFTLLPCFDVAETGMEGVLSFSAYHFCDVFEFFRLDKQVNLFDLDCKDVPHLPINFHNLHKNISSLKFYLHKPLLTRCRKTYFQLLHWWGYKETRNYMRMHRSSDMYKPF